MEQIDRQRFAHCLLAASELYGKAITEGIASIWWDALRTYDVETVETAFRRHMANPDTGQFMPKPADIVRIAGGTSQDGALVAWAKVDKAVRSIGTYATVAFDDPLIQRVVQDMGGWIALGTKGEDEWPFIANEFRNRYVGFRQRAEVPDYPAVLLGITDAQNARKGYKMSAPVLIGDRTKALAVSAKGSDAPAVGFHRIDQAAANAVENVLRLVDAKPV